MNMEQFRELKRRAKEDLKIYEIKLKENSLENNSLYQKYLSIYIDEKSDRIKEEWNLKRRHSKLWEEYKNIGKDNRYLDKKDDIQACIFNDKEYDEIHLRLNIRIIITEFLELTLKNIATRSFNIRNYQDRIKFEEGS